MIDVCYFEKISYFLVSLNLLIVVLIIKVSRYIIYDYTKQRLLELEKYLEIHKVNVKRIEFNLKDENLQPQLGDLYFIPYHVLLERLPQMSELWIIYRKINMYMTDIEAVRDYYNSHFMFFISLFYFIGWSYILISILLHWF